MAGVPVGSAAHKNLLVAQVEVVAAAGSGQQREAAAEVESAAEAPMERVVENGAATRSKEERLVAVVFGLTPARRV